jgi:hypothetical protein
LTVNLSAGTTRFEIPPALLVPGRPSAKTGIVAIEVTFSTAE